MCFIVISLFLRCLPRVSRLLSSACRNLWLISFATGWSLELCFPLYLRLLVFYLTSKFVYIAIIFLLHGSLALIQLRPVSSTCSLYFTPVDNICSWWYSRCHCQECITIYQFMYPTFKVVNYVGYVILS